MRLDEEGITSLDREYRSTGTGQVTLLDWVLEERGQRWDLQMALVLIRDECYI